MVGEGCGWPVFEDKESKMVGEGCGQLVFKDEESKMVGAGCAPIDKEGLISI